MNVKDMGEFGLIDRIAGKIKKGRGVVAGIGDDAAVLVSGKKGFYDLLACDMFVEDVHFDLKNISAFQIGWKAVAANISDIAAMGGIPRYAVVSLGLKGNEDIKFCDELYGGMKKVADHFGVSIVGGDTVASPKALTISVAITGEVEKKLCVLRGGAQKNEAILVTGSLGGSILKKHCAFTPRVNEARFLVGNFNISSMMDITDGLLIDLSKICSASGVGALILADKVPVSAAAKKTNDKKTALDHALADGEDFELLFTVPISEAPRLMKQFRRKFNLSLSLIGSTTLERGVRLISADGVVTEPEIKGYDHFKIKN